MSAGRFTQLTPEHWKFSGADLAKAADIIQTDCCLHYITVSVGLYCDPEIQLSSAVNLRLRCMIMTRQGLGLVVACRVPGDFDKRQKGLP
jgi:hypothetical protein